MSELAELNLIGARPQKNSGRGKHQKGDGVLSDLLVDVKESGKSFSLNTTVWGKICTDAVSQGYEPVLHLVFGQEGTPRVRLWVQTMERAMQAQAALEIVQSDEYQEFLMWKEKQENE